MTNLPDLPTGSLLAELRRGVPPAARVNVQRALIEKVDDPRFKRPVCRFLTELPWIGEDEEQQLRIAARLFTADDPDDVDSAGTTASQDITGKTVTVCDLKVNHSDQEKGPGGYLLLEVEMADLPEPIVVNTGAPQAMIRLARAWAEGHLPITGSFAAIPGTGGNGRNPAVTFIAEGDL